MRGSECTWERPPMVVEVEDAIAQALRSYGEAMIEELPEPSPRFPKPITEYGEGCVDGWNNYEEKVKESLTKFNTFNT